MTIIYNQPASEYFAIDALSASGAKLLNRSAAHYLYAKANPPKPSPQMAFGTLVHSLVLEPDSVSALYAASPKYDKRTTIGKAGAAAFEAVNVGKTVVDLEDFQRAQRVARAVLDHPTAGGLLGNASAREVTVLWTQHGVPCKARLDAISGINVLDLKTARDASGGGFSRAAATYQYHVQAAHYLSAATAGGFAQDPYYDPLRFIFIAVESTEPFNAAVYELTHADIVSGRVLMASAAAVYKTLSDPFLWPGYPAGVNTIALPYNGADDVE